MEKFKKYQTLIIILGIILVSFFSWRYMLKPGFFSMHDDMQFMRLYELDKCFADGQIPCRWVPDLGYGYGYPLFNYYSPLPYYLGELVHLVLGVSFISTTKILFALGFVLSGIFMYFLAREFWGKIGGFLAAIFYIYAPYHAVDVYVRGAMAEHWALVWFPLIFLAIYKLISDGRLKWLVLLAVSYGCLLLSHNIMSMLFSVAAFTWGVVWLIKFKAPKKIFSLALGVFWGVCIASFFLLPALLEKKFVHTETMLMGYFNFLAHYVTIKQLFLKTDWGWGASVYGPDDGMPFMIGILHWAISLISLFLAIIFWRKKENLGRLWALGLAVVFLFGTAFMAHERSTPIWLGIKILEYLQFPWRFLGLVIFFASFAAGSIVLFFKSRALKLLMAGALIVALIFSVRFYFQPETHYNITDEDRLTGKDWQLALTNAIFDYLPVYATYPPAEEAPKEPQVLEGKGVIENLQKGTDWQKFEAEVSSQEAVIRLSLYDFPGWQVKVDGQKVDINHDNFLGLISVSIPSGNHQVEAKLSDTPVRKIGNSLSLVSLGVLMVIGLKVARRKK